MIFSRYHCELNPVICCFFCHLTDRMRADYLAQNLPIAVLTADTFEDFVFQPDRCLLVWTAAEWNTAAREFYE